VLETCACTDTTRHHSAADLEVLPSASELELLYARARVVIASRYASLLAPAAPVRQRSTTRTRLELGPKHSSVWDSSVGTASTRFRRRSRWRSSPPAGRPERGHGHCSNEPETPPEPYATLTGRWQTRPWSGGHTGSSNDQSTNRLRMLLAVGLLRRRSAPSSHKSRSTFFGRRCSVISDPSVQAKKTPELEAWGQV
jgi:hypothetical protein